MGVLKSAAGGATAGGALGGVPGALIGAGIGAAGDIVSGILGIKSQKSANKTNLRIAQETNAANERINQANIALQRELLRRQQDYNSFANQRKMLEEAGYNPADLFGQSSSAVSSGLASAPSPVPMQAAQVKPVDYSMIGDVSQRGADLMTKVQNFERGEIAKQREDTALGVEIATFFDKIQKLRAEADSALSQRDIDSLKVEYQRILNKYADQSEQARVRNMFASEFANYARGGLDTVTEQIQSQFGGQLAQWQINVLKKTVDHMASQIDLYHEQGLTEQETRRKLKSDEYLNYMTGKLRLKESQAQDIKNYILDKVKDIEAGITALSFLNGSEALSSARNENALRRVFGAKQEEAKLTLLNKLGQQIEENAKHTAVQRRLAEKELDYYDVKSAVGILKDVVSSYKGLATAPDMDLQSGVRSEFIRKAQSDGYTRSEAKFLFDTAVSPLLLE